MPKFTPRRRDGSPMDPITFFPLFAYPFRLALHRAIGDSQKGMARWAISDPISGQAIRPTLPVRASSHKVAMPLAREVLEAIIAHETPARFAAVINAARAATPVEED